MPKIKIHIDSENPENNTAEIDGVNLMQSSFFVLEYVDGKWRYMAGNGKAKTIQEYIDAHKEDG